MTKFRSWCINSATGGAHDSIAKRRRWGIAIAPTRRESMTATPVAATAVMTAPMTAIIMPTTMVSAMTSQYSIQNTHFISPRRTLNSSTLCLLNRPHESTRIVMH